MRTNIDLDDELMDQAKLYSQTTTKKELVHEALATYVAVKKEQNALKAYKEKVRDIQSRTESIRLTEDSRDLIRKDRDTR